MKQLFKAEIITFLRVYTMEHPQFCTFFFFAKWLFLQSVSALLEVKDENASPQARVLE